MSANSAAVTLEDLKKQFRNYQRYAAWAFRLVVAWAVLAGAWLYQAYSSNLTLAQAGLLIALGLATVKARQILLNQAEAKFQKFFVLLPGYASVTGPNNAYSEIISQYQKGNRALVCGLIGMFLALEGMGMALVTKPIESIVILRDNTPMKCKRNSDGRAIDHHSLQVMRQQAIKAVREGQTVQSVAAAFGVNIRSVFRWLSDFANGGQNALLAKPVPGRPPRISAEEMRWLAQAVRDHSPLQYRFEFGLWTLSLIAELIRRQFGKTLSLSAVSRVMKLLGFTAQKPLYRAWQQDAALVRQWENETYPAIRAEARAAGARIYFADESGLRSDYHAGTTWAPQGETPVVEVTGRRFSVNMLSAVGTRGEFRFMLHDGTVTASVFREFLKRLLIGAEQPVFVIVDGHPVHKARLVRAFVEEQAGRLKLFYLPPYSPQLNPDEQVWGHVKRSVSRRLVQNREEMKKLALGALRRIQKLPELVKSFFRHPDCRYTAA